MLNLLIINAAIIEKSHIQLNKAFQAVLGLGYFWMVLSAYFISMERSLLTFAARGARHTEQTTLCP